MESIPLSFRPTLPTTIILVTRTFPISSTSGYVVLFTNSIRHYSAQCWSRKAQELVATPYRFGGDKSKAEIFFEQGLASAFGRMRNSATANFPLTVYYAFKQAETEEDDDKDLSMPSGLASTGWETMLEGLLRAEFQVTGTWPMRSELSNRPVASGTNALASSIVLVCRPRPTDAPLTTRRDFINTLRGDLPHALKQLQHGNIAPVDLAQAAIGPGMAVFSRYSRVLEMDGSPMRVRTALQLINQALDEVLAEQEGEYDRDTRWAVAWFEQHGHNEGQYGTAETLSKAKDTSVEGLVRAGIVAAGAGKVRLKSREQLTPTGTPCPTSASPCGKSPSTSSAPSTSRARQGPPPSCGRWAAATARPPATWPTASTPHASAKAGRRRPSPTTAWWCPGRRSHSWPRGCRGRCGRKGLSKRKDAEDTEGRKRISWDLKRKDAKTPRLRRGY